MFSNILGLVFINGSMGINGYRTYLTLRKFNVFIQYLHFMEAAILLEFFTSMIL